MTPSKRLFDLFAAMILAALLLPALLIVGMCILIKDGRPIFFASERMKTPDESFKLIKFRTMAPVPSDTGVSGGHKSARITKTGAFLRRSRLDELPQVWNVLRGDISFVGPRPQLREYVERFPELHAKVLQSRPGITGLATLKFHAREEALLARSQSDAQTDQIYTRNCLPRKARLDLIYQANRSFCFDLRIMLATVFKTRL